MKRNSMEKIKAGIIGATSLTARILLKFLVFHPQVEISLLISETSPGKQIEEIHRELRGIFSKKLVSYNPQEILEKCNFIFICKSHGEFLERTGELLDLSQREDKPIRIIDLSADYRLQNPELYPIWYGFEHKKNMFLKKAVYGLCEIHMEAIKNASLIANPGCYPTCVILGVAPLFKARLIEGEAVVVDAFSGVSGAGMKPNERNMAMATMENILPYKIGIHPHTPEIEQELSFLSSKEVLVSFIPHVVPFKYGILTNIYLKIKKNASDELPMLYEKFYQGKKFVRLLSPGEYPQIKDVVGTNLCEIGLVYDKRTEYLIVMSVIDNLIKGGAGQAVQNMNIMFGLDEGEGLPFSK